MKKLLLTLSLAFMAAHAQTFTQCGKVVENFTIAIDYSGSMQQKFAHSEKSKTQIAKDLLLKLNEALPEKNFKVSFITLAPFTTALKDTSWDRKQLSEIIAAHKDNLEVFGRPTNLGVGLTEYKASLKANTESTAMIILTDGNSYRGIDTAEALKELYKENSQLKVHFISFANNQNESDKLDKLQKVNSNSQIFKAQDLITNEQLLDTFISNVFYSPCDELTLSGINFAFDKYTIDAKSEKILKEALDYINTRSPTETIEINGWTDYCGSDSYNLTLSQNRALAVKNWFVAHGIKESRLKAIGRGKSFKFDNETDLGRYQNRRMDLRFLESGVTSSDHLRK